MESIKSFFGEHYLSTLQNLYAFYNDVYSMSFKNRFLFEIGVLHIQVEKSDQIQKLSKDELEKKIKELKKPWWNWLFFWSRI